MERALRTDTGEIRFFWKLALTPMLILVLIVISRIGLILVVQQVFILQGTPSSVALQNAQIFVSESSEGQAIASSIDVSLILLLVFIFVTRIEKREFHWISLGLDLRRNTLPFVGIGLVIGCAFFLGNAVFGALLNTLEFPIMPDFGQWSLLTTLIASMIFSVLNSFWQEIVFRGYLQTRAVEEYGRLIGIVAVTAVFVILHGLVQALSPIGILTGLLLFSFIGLLYDKTKSLYLVSVIHAVLNFLPVLFSTWWQGLETVMTYGIALVLLVLVIHQIEQGRPNSLK